MLKAMIGMGGTRCLQWSRGQSRCVLCLPPVLCRLGQLSPPEQPLSALPPCLSCSPSPYLLIQPLQRQTGVFVLKLRLPEGTEGRAEVTSVEQRWERGREVSELPSSHRKHGIEENELQGAGEVLFFLVFLYIPESVAATAHSSTSPSEKH